MCHGSENKKVFIPLIKVFKKTKKGTFFLCLDFT